jgi:hypothetical protein
MDQDCGDMPDRVVITASRVRWIIIAIGLVIVGIPTFVVFFLIPGGGPAYSVLFLIFLVLPFVLTAAMVIRPRALVLTAEGFSERMWGRGQSYLWNEIEALGVLDLGAGLGFGRHVVLRLTDEARARRAAVVRSMRRMGLKDYDASVTNEYLIGPDELCGLMETWRSRGGSVAVRR